MCVYLSENITLHTLMNTHEHHDEHVLVYLRHSTCINSPLKDYCDVLKYLQGYHKAIIFNIGQLDQLNQLQIKS